MKHDAACILADAPFDPAGALARFTQAQSGCGAVASFTGLVRAHSKAGDRVTALFLDHHPRLTLASMQAIHDEARTRFDLQGARIVHRCGLVLAGEPVVFVGAAAAHRRAALDAVECMMDRLKTEAIFWKREDSASGSQWIEPSADDYRARDRWQAQGPTDQVPAAPKRAAR